MQPVTRMTAATAAKGGWEGGRMARSREGFEHSALPKTISYAPWIFYVTEGRGRTVDVRGIWGFILCSVSAPEKHDRSDRKKRNMINETRGKQENYCHISNSSNLDPLSLPSSCILTPLKLLVQLHQVNYNVWMCAPVATVCVCVWMFTLALLHLFEMALQHAWL